MDGETMKQIMRDAGLSVSQLAAFMYYADERGLRRMIDGEKPISGPIQRILELIRDQRCDDILDGLDEARGRPSSL